MEQEKTSLLILDVSGLLYRAFYALPPLTSPSGIPSGALFGFVRSVLKISEKIKPTHIIAIFDGPNNKKSRLELYADYKAHRKPTPPELSVQIDSAKTFCNIWGIPMLSENGVEADDTIASVATITRPWASSIYICSADKDLLQLVDDRTFIINPAKEDRICTAAYVEDHYGIKPEQMIDYLSLIGDDSDNVPGIEGIGPKTAISLLNQFFTLEKILDNANTIPGKKGELLKKGKESALLSKKLITLAKNLPVPETQTAYLPTPINIEAVSAFFISMGFKTLLSLLPRKELSTLDHSILILETIQGLSQFLSTLQKNSSVYIAPHVENKSLIGFGIGSNSTQIAYVSCTSTMTSSDALNTFSSWYTTQKSTIIAHGIKDLYHLKFPLQPHLIFDTEIAAWLLFPDEKSYVLEDVCFRLLEKEKPSIQEILGKGKKTLSLTQIPSTQRANYANVDILTLIQLHDLLEKKLHEDSLHDLYTTIELPLIPILFEVEKAGVFLDIPVLSSLEKTALAKRDSLTEEIYALAGTPFNIHSPKQLSDILFNTLKLPAQRKGKQHLSTDVSVLENLVSIHPIAEKLLEYRQIDKLLSTYIVPLPQMIQDDGRIHCILVQTGTATGRIACQNPNLQNIPIKTPLGKEIRKAFCPQHQDAVYLSADYSQIELRILAHMSQDPTLIAAFKNNVDIHASTASAIFHIPLNDVTETMRRQAKAVNFGLIYGQQAFGLAKELNITPKEAQKIIDNYFSEYATIKNLFDSIIAEAREKGYAQTLFGRRRFLPDLKSHDFFARASAERLAINTPFQGTGADIIKKSMLNLHDFFSKHAKEGSSFKTRMILQIHDELLFEIPHDELPFIEPIIKKYMEEAVPLSVPLVVNITIGKNWKEC